MLEEREQVAGRVVERDPGIAGPHRGDERLHEVPHEVRREPAVVEELPERRVVAGGGELPLRQPVEARDLRQHPQVARPPQVGGGREETSPAEGAGPLQTALVVADRHRHLGGLGGDTELGEQPQQHGIGARVVHDEAGVDGQPVHEVRVGVTAEPVVGLEERDLRGAGGDVRRGESGHAGTHDGDPRRRRLRAHQVGIAKSATGSVVGSSGEVPSGSTEIPTACASRAVPWSSTWWRRGPPASRRRGPCRSRAGTRAGRRCPSGGAAMPSVTMTALSTFRETTTVAFEPSWNSWTIRLASLAVSTCSVAVSFGPGAVLPRLQDRHGPEPSTVTAAAATRRPVHRRRLRSAGATSATIGGIGRTVGDPGQHRLAERRRRGGLAEIGQQGRRLAEARRPRPGTPGTPRGAGRTSRVRGRRARRWRRRRTAHARRS